MQNDQQRNDESKPIPPMGPLSESIARMNRFFDTNRFDKPMDSNAVMAAPIGYTDAGED